MQMAERAMSMVLTLCAVIFAGILVKREFVDSKSTIPAADTTPPHRVANWPELLNNRVVLRSPNARVVVAEFADLECPACKQFHTTLKEASAEVGVDVGLVMLHYPLSIHRFANTAARALECADSLGVAGSFVDVAYAKQDSFGLKPWTGYALEAGVKDTATFQECVTNTTSLARVHKGRSLGDSMEVRGTPAVFINGWRFSSPPDHAQLRAALQALAAGKSPPEG